MSILDELAGTKLEGIADFLGFSDKYIKDTYDVHLARAGELEALKWLGRIYVLKMTIHLLELNEADMSIHQFLETLLEPNELS